MTRIATIEAAVNHSNLLVGLTRRLTEDRTGGILGTAIEMLVGAVHPAAALAYRIEGRDLVLVSEHGVPFTAKPWLARLRVDEDPWFVAQRVARSRKVETTTDVAAARTELSIRPTLHAAAWHALCAVPLQAGRDVLGVLVLAADSEHRFDDDTVMLLETVGGILALALEREQVEQQSRDEKVRDKETAHLTTMGMLAASVARDLTTPLGTVQLQLEQQHAQLQRLGSVVGNADADVVELLNSLEQRLTDMGHGVRHTQGITSRLLALSRQTKPEPVDLERLTDGVLQLMRSTLESRNTQLAMQSAGVELLVDGREEALQMLLIQLLLHAVQASEGTAHSPPSIDVTLGSDGDSHFISVESSGRESSRSANRTVKLGNGGANNAAVGLELAKQTVMMHRGHIETSSSAAGGFAVRVVLPSSKSAANRGHRPPRWSAYPAQQPSGRPSLLWIDEDTDLAAGAGRLISSHDVHVASSIAEAKAQLCSLSSPPELILCAVSLPDGSGTELHAALDEAVASRCVFVTSGVIEQHVADYLRRSGCPTLFKPVSVEQVLSMLGQCPDSVPPIAPTLHQEPADDLDIGQRDTLPEPITARRLQRVAAELACRHRRRAHTTPPAQSVMAYAQGLTDVQSP